MFWAYLRDTIDTCMVEAVQTDSGVGDEVG